MEREELKNKVRKQLQDCDKQDLSWAIENELSKDELIEIITTLDEERVINIIMNLKGGNDFKINLN